MSQQIASFNPASATPVPIDTTMGQQASKQQLYVWNESNYGIRLTLGSGKQLTVPPWLGYPILARPYPMPVLTWAIAYQLSIGSPPVSLVNIEVFDPDEPLPSTIPISLSSRATNIGNQGGTGTGNNLINDGNAPGTEIMEATPNDQGVSAVKEANDGSGQTQVLSAGVQRNVRNVVRGNATTGKAVIDVGDAGDLSITTFHGTLDANMSVPSATTAQRVDSTNSGNVTTPQVSTATAGAGIGVRDNKTARFVELYPTETDATARGIQLDYVDASGVLHAGIYLDATGIPRFRTGDVLRVSSMFTGTGAGTFTHGLSFAPSFVGITTTEGNSTETVGVDTIGSATVHVNQGVAGWPWAGMATG